MKNFVYFVLAIVPFFSVASAQNIPAVDIFGGYSYYRFDQPQTSVTNSTHLALNGVESLACSRSPLSRRAPISPVRSHVTLQLRVPVAKPCDPVACPVHTVPQLWAA